MPTPTLTGSADVQCLVAGSPWEVSKPDLETQLTGLMRTVNVKDVHIVGDQILTATPDLKASIADTTTTTITVDMDAGMTMVMTQKHAGSSAGQWRADDGKLTPTGAWTGEIKTTTKVAINGRTANSPATFPTQALGKVAYDRQRRRGVLNLTVEGSPFVYLFR